MFHGRDCRDYIPAYMVVIIVYHSYISIETTPGLHPQAGLNGSDRAAEQADSLQKKLYPNKHLTSEHAD